MEKKNTPVIFVVFTALFSLGAFYGSFIYMVNDSLFKVPMNILTFFAIPLLSVFIFYLSGYSIIGQPICFLNVILFGTVTSYIVCLFFKLRTFYGMFKLCIVFLPYLIVCIFAIFIAYRECIRLSNLFLKSIKAQEALSLESIKLYNIKFIVILVLIAFSVVLKFLSDVVVKVF